jgi:hypothetical protein
VADPLDIAQRPMPQPGNVNKPTSGTYGEGAELDRLRSQLPSSGGGPGPNGPGAPPAGPAAPPPGPTPPPSVGGGPAGAPPGVPDALLDPTQRPDVPVHSPLQGDQPGPAAPPLAGLERRLAVLEMLASSPEVADETREWALALLRALTDDEA